MNLYEQITEPIIKRAIEEFYKRAFVDPMICHFFVGKDILDITAKQQAFAIAMLGGPKNYQGRTLTDAHLPFTVKPPHFGRRQVIMKEVLNEMDIDSDATDAWLELEQNLNQ